MQIDNLYALDDMYLATEENLRDTEESDLQISLNLNKIAAWQGQVPEEIRHYYRSYTSPVFLPIQGICCIGCQARFSLDEPYDSSRHNPKCLVLAKENELKKNKAPTNTNKRGYEFI